MYSWFQIFDFNLSGTRASTGTLTEVNNSEGKLDDGVTPGSPVKETWVCWITS